MHAHGDALAGLLGDGQQLDRVSGPGGPCDVVRGDPGDALARDVVGRDAGVEGEAGQDRGLGRGVVALDVGRGVRLGVAELLRLLDRRVEVEAAGGHLVEHVVGRAVHDAQDAAHVVARQGLAHGTHDRDGARDGGLVVDVDAGGVGRLVERGAVGREQRLVGGDDGGPALDGAQQQGAGRLGAAHHLDDDVRAVHEGLRVLREQLTRYGGVAGAARVADGDAGELERRARAGGEIGALLQQHPGHLGAHDATAQQCDTQPAGGLGDRHSDPAFVFGGRPLPVRFRTGRDDATRVTGASGMRALCLTTGVRRKENACREPAPRSRVVPDRRPHSAGRAPPAGLRPR